MRHLKLHKTEALDSGQSLENEDMHKVSRLGLISNIPDDKNENNFIYISTSGIAKLIFDLNSAYFEEHKFNVKKYPNHDIRLQNLDPKIFRNNLKSIEDLKGITYRALSEVVVLNTTIAYLDNRAYRNSFKLQIDTQGKLIYYSYNIYYKTSTDNIKRADGKVTTAKRHKAIVLQTDSVESIIFFVEKAYGKEEAINLRKAMYNEFVKKLTEAKDIETLKILYSNLPNYIKLGYTGEEDIKTIPYKLPDELLWRHFKLFVSYDEMGSNTASAIKVIPTIAPVAYTTGNLRDASYYVVYLMILMSPKFCLQKFLEDQSLVVKVYNGLDDQSAFEEFLGIYSSSKTYNFGSNSLVPTNKDAFVTHLCSNIQLFATIKDTSVVNCESSGAHFHQGIHIVNALTSEAQKHEITYTLDSHIVASNTGENKGKVYLSNRWKSKQGLGYSLSQSIYDQTSNDIRYEYRQGYNEIGEYYDPLDVVQFTFYDDQGQPITINAPTIFVKHFSDVKEWEKTHEAIRVGVNVLMLLASTATILASGGGSLLLYAAIADLGLASADIIIQAEKKEISSSEAGKAFLEAWEKIYNIGGLVTFSPVAIKAVVTYGPKLLSSGADLLQVTRSTITNPQTYKKVKDITTKAIHSIEIPNFNKTGLEILKKGFKSIPELKNADKLQELGVIFAKGGEDTMAAIYKGVVIASGKVKDIGRQLRKALDELRENRLKNYLEDLLNWKAYKSFVGTGGLIKYKKVLSRNMIGQEKGMACAAACIEQLSVDLKISEKYSQFDIFDLANAGIESGMKNSQIEDAMIGVFGINNVKSAGYGSYSGVDIFKDIARYLSESGGTWIALVREETRHSILVDKIIGNNVYIRDPWPLEGLKGIEAGKPGVEAILDLDYFAKIWEQTGGIMLKVK